MSLSIGNVYSMEQAGGSLFYDEQLVMLDLKEAFRVIKNNNKFIPDSSLKLGEILNRLVNESKEDVNVISRELHNINGSAYALATSLTSIAPNVKSVSATFTVQPSSGFGYVVTISSYVATVSFQSIFVSNAENLLSTSVGV